VVDLVISTMTVNADRETQIDFSNVYYLAGQSLLVPKDSAIASVKGLAGKKVCSAKGSTSEANIRKFAPQAELILFDSYSECVTAMAGKRADAVSTDDNILLGFASQDKNLKLVGGQFTFEPYGMGIKKGNPEFQQLVNDVLKSMKTSGKWKELFKKEIGDKTGVATPEPPIDDGREIQKGAPQP
jgi:putative glutamine transport system substrate-binding protein